MVRRAVRDRPVISRIIVCVHDLVIFVCMFVVVLSQGAYLLTCHDGYIYRNDIGIYLFTYLRTYEQGLQAGDDVHENYPQTLLL